MTMTIFLAALLPALQDAPRKAPAPKPAPAPQAKAAPARKPVYISEERRNAAKEAAEKILKAVREGRDVSPSPLVEQIRTAMRIQDSNHVAVGAAMLGLARHISAERRREAADLSERVILKFNATGEISMNRDEREGLEAFRTAAVAADALQKASSPASTKGVPAKLVADVRVAAKRLLDSYNRSGAYDSADEDKVQEFQRAIAKDE